jgi:hypothetical protein
MKPNKDFFIECNEGGMMSPPEFERTFCNQCKNRQCVRADWAFSSWDKRILTQVDRLLTNPNIVLQSEASRWEGVSDFEGFQEPQVIEVWGVPEEQPQAPLIIGDEREEADTVPVPPVDPPEIEEDDAVMTSAPKIELEPQPIPQPQQVYQNPLNTPPQEITIGEAPKPAQPQSRPKRFQADPWAVSETLPVGGKFKMGK